MMPIKKICPYPGLRPFTEEESIFFKGRDEHIEQVTRQLEKKKFLMLTGASGDGKSSLVYAGVIPNARAQFFKAKYNNWLITSFRPEHAPLKNMASVIARQLNLNEDATVKELGFGFSALVNLYTSSPFYVDYNSDKWKNADESAKKQMKKHAANLFILVDQFEEFFTNPENYSHGVPSKASQTVVNLLLETAKAALAKDLPIYIICTMRSDYIGQCAAFRDLPGYIGFSQFFVPRLKRKELIQVVEEPAVLSGNKISNRLIETLLNELSEGYDQLPVLQHALNHVWNKANEENGEMDLIHLAKIAGLPAGYLEEKDKNGFEKWFNHILEQKKEYKLVIQRNFEKPSLENVLDAHANELFETAHEKAGVAKDTAQNIIKTAFQCLTRIDENRAVRSRMTLGEITQIVNLPDVTHDAVDAVLDIFREQGNTFISPFITDQPETRNLKPEAVLDITHESLIRNWKRLTDWAWEEDNNWNTFQDFYKQLKRWVDSGKSDGYLLPIGPLNYFEQWFNTSHPNKYWLARYNKSELTKEEKLTKAGTILNSANEFIRKSARNLWFTRTVIRYGVNKIAASFAVLALLLACSFYSYDYYKKRNIVVLHDIIGKGKIMLNSTYVKSKIKADFIINCERLTPGVLKKILNEDIREDTARFDVAFEMFMRVQNLTDDECDTHNPLMLPLMHYMDKKLNNLLNMDFYKKKVVAEDNLRRLNYLLLASLFYLEHDSAPDVKIILERQLWNCYKHVSTLLSQPADSISASTTELNESFLLLGALCDNNILINMESIMKTISPFESDSSKKRFEKMFPEKMNWKVGWRGFLSHNGGYQIVGCLYGAMRKTAQVLNCLDSLTIQNKEYKSFNDNGFSTLFGYCAKGGSDAGSLNLLLNKYVKNTNSEPNVEWRKITRKYFLEPNSEFPIEYDISGNKNYYMDFIPSGFTLNCANLIWDAYLMSLQNKEPEYNHLPGWLTTGFSDEDYFELALYYKKKGAYTASLPGGKKDTETYFYKAFDYFSKISETSLSKEFALGSGRRKSIKYSTLFLYPGIINEENDRVPYSLWANRTFTAFPFLEYVIDNPKVWSSCKTKEDIEALKAFLYEYFRAFRYSDWNAPSQKRKKFQYRYFQSIQRIITSHPECKGVNMDIVNLLMAEKFFYDKEDTNGIEYLKQLNLPEVFNKSSFYGEITFSEVNVNLLTEFAKNFARNNYFDEARKSVILIPESWQRVNALLDIASVLVEEGKADFLFQYLDLLFAETKAMKQIPLKLFRILGQTGGNDVFALVQTQMKNIDDKAKPRALSNFVSGIAVSGSYFKAISVIPGYISGNKELELYTRIINVEIQKENLNLEVWNKYDNENFGYRRDDYLAENGVFYISD